MEGEDPEACDGDHLPDANAEAEGCPVPGAVRKRGNAHSLGIGAGGGRHEVFVAIG